jgi:cold shock CspA family protein
MGSSQETFSKKEKEKKKLKKKQDKEQKKEERKANSDKGKSLDDMMAYVDADGNISSTPPDPNAKKAVYKTEDIQIGISRQEAPEPAEITRKGTVTFYNDSKGFGFIKDHVSQDSVFVHVNNLMNPIKENDKVTFETEVGPKGLNAIKVKAID